MPYTGMQSVVRVVRMQAQQQKVWKRTMLHYSDKKWLFVSNMNTEKCAHAACVMHEKIFVVGGLDANGRAMKTIK